LYQPIETDNAESPALSMTSRHRGGADSDLHDTTRRIRLPTGAASEEEIRRGGLMSPRDSGDGRETADVVRDARPRAQLCDATAWAP